MNIECVVIGAGIIGLACARQLAMANREVVILEAADTFGTETSARNSEVIHAGIYYPAGSLKAKTCVLGNRRMYEYCVSHGIAHQRLGKLIVAATPAELPVLHEIKNKAAANGVLDLEYLSISEINALEPALQVKGALFSPSTGIIDSHGLMLALLGDAERHGALLAVRSTVLQGIVEKKGIRLTVVGDNNETQEIQAKMVINSAGLAAPRVAGALLGMPQDKIPKAYFCKGSYFTLSTPAPFKHLVYPVPNAAGLGVHVTLDLSGQARFGPDTEWVDLPNYAVDIKRSHSFYQAIRSYWPDLKEGALHPGYAAVRPKIVGAGEPAADFVIQGSSVHGVTGLVNLFGIESPGLTSCLVIAEAVLSELTDV